MYYLDESRQTYGRDTDEAAQLREKLEKKLHQQRPYTGKEIKNTLRWGYGEFTVTAGAQDCCVKLQNLEDKSRFVLVYVRANEKTTVHVADGSYIVKYTTGPFWYGTDSMFGRNATYSKADDILTFTTTSSQYTAYELTLYSVFNGNLSIEDIDPEQF